MYERCDFCGEGTLEPRSQTVDLDQGRRVEVHYHECDWCGSRLALPADKQLNKQSIRGAQ